MAGIMIAAPKSGSGKTMVTCGLLTLLKRKGYCPMACKCGPDYIDGLFHRTVLGVETENLDSYFETEDHMRRKVFRAMKDHILVAEGAMGYFDGLGGVSMRGSCQEIRRILGLPALLTVDAKGASLSLLAMIQGFLDFEREAAGESGIRGIFLNRASKGVYQMIKPLVEERFHIPVVGYLPELDFLRVGSRHLGLILPDEVEGLRQQLERLADCLEEGMDWESFWKIAEGKLPWDISPKGEEQGTLFTEPFSLAVARDPAFCFYYQDNLRALEAAGAILHDFSPLTDEALPPGCCGILLGGGYPENFAKELGENQAMRKAISTAAEGGMPILAECGGYLYLLDSLEGTDGRSYPMAGVLRGHGYRVGRTGRFGYISLHPDKETPYLTFGEEIRGHEFHYWDCCLEEGKELFCMEAVKPAGGRRWPCMRSYKGVLAGFPHLYYPSCPQLGRRFAMQCLAYGKEQRQ